jgi:hypothetical protein
MNHATLLFEHDPQPFANDDAPLGTMLLAASAQGLAASAFGEREELLAELRSRFPKA